MTATWASGEGLDPGESGTLQLTFTPSVEGSVSGSVTVFSFFNSGGSFGQLDLTGSGESGEVILEESLTAAGLNGGDADPMAEPFGDGVPNLMKYAFNMNLAGNDHSILEGAGASGLPHTAFTEDGGTATLRVEFVRRKGSGLVYTPQRSATLGEGAFLPMVGAMTVTDINDDFERVEVVETCDTTVLLKCFARVKVELPMAVPAIQVVELVDAGVQTITAGDAGSITTTFTNNGSYWYFGAGAGMWRGLSNGGFLLYSPGADIAGNTAYSLAFISNGDGSGTRYLMLDVDNNGTHETVVETTLVLTAVSASTINRYAYRIDGSDLEISDAVVAFTSLD